MFRIDRHRIKLLADAKVVTPQETPEDIEEEEPAPSPQEEWETQRVILEAEFNEKADKILRSAQEEAERIRESANSDAAELKAQAVKDGYTEGSLQAQIELDRAMEDLQAERLEQSLAVSRLLEEFNLAKERYFENLSTDFLDLILSIARKVTGAAIEKYDDVFESMIKRALHEMKLEGKLLIRVSTADHERLFSSGSATFILGNESVTATMIADKEVEKYGCIIESEGETVDTGMQTQFNYIEIAFRDMK